MANYYSHQQQQQPYLQPQNLQFYPSSYTSSSPNQQPPVSGHSTPFQAYSGGIGSGGNNNAAAGFGAGFAQPGFGGIGMGGMGGVSGRMGEQGGLRMGWLAAFGTEGYDGEPPLLEELGVNFGHIKMKVRFLFILFLRTLSPCNC